MLRVLILCFVISPAAALAHPVERPAAHTSIHMAADCTLNGPCMVEFAGYDRIDYQTDRIIASVLDTSGPPERAVTARLLCEDQRLFTAERPAVVPPGIRVRIPGRPRPQCSVTVVRYLPRDVQPPQLTPVLPALPATQRGVACDHLTGRCRVYPTRVELPVRELVELCYQAVAGRPCRATQRCPAGTAPVLWGWYGRWRENLACLPTRYLR